METLKTTNKNTKISSGFLKSLKRLKELPGNHSAIAGLSGGVDSSLTAALLFEAGWEIEGLTLWLLKGQGSCCSDGLVDAAGLCDQLGIPHHIVDSRETFKKEIINNVVNGYQQGITPSPCSRCNRSVKFSEMLKWAENNKKFQRLATGHYARIRYMNEKVTKTSLPGDGVGKHKLMRGKDENKDQSYFLYDLPQNIIERIIFPLGELTKQETRQEAMRYSLRTAQKPESQDLCLAEHYGSMNAFLSHYLPSNKGEIVLKDGRVIGSHDGIQNFTIGQRKGLGVSWDVPLHVISLDSQSNKVFVAPRSESGKDSCIVREINWVSINPPEEALEIEVQIRYRSRPVKAKIIPIKATSKDIANSRPHRCKIVFNDEQFSITPGQAAVFYKGDFLLGGGLIVK